MSNKTDFSHSQLDSLTIRLDPGFTWFSTAGAAPIAAYVRLEPSDTDCAYAAGIFDGEGSICISTRKNRSKKYADRVEVNVTGAITTTDVAMLKWLRERWGGYVGKPIIIPSAFAGSRKLFSRPRTTWTISANYLRVLLADLKPYLKLKAKVAANAQGLLDYQKDRRATRAGYSEAEYKKQMAFLTKHRAMSTRRHG